MKNRITFLFTVGFAIISCGTNHDTSKDEISGTYVREYSFKVENLQSGAEVGMRIVRDTIFIRTIGQIYEISNHKWRLNDYDNEGWKSMEHDDDRPISTYKASFNLADSTLNSETTQPLYLDFKNKLIYKGKQSNVAYERVE